MRVKEAKQLCADFVQVPARPERYAAVSSRMMQALTSVTPDVEVFSVDEAFLDVTTCQQLWGHPYDIAQMAKRKVQYATGGVLCSVGVSGDKTTAKYAAKLHKPNGLTVIPPWEAKERLAPVPVTQLCGIAKGIGNYLAQRGVHTCGDMVHLPIGELARRFGNPGRRIWYMAQGLDPEPVTTHVPPPKSMGHSKVMPPNTRDKTVIEMYLLHMSEKVAARLRRHDLEAQRYLFGLNTQQGWVGGKPRTVLPTADGKEIYRVGQNTFQHCWQGQGVHQIQVTALDPRAMGRQPDLFAAPQQKRVALNHVIDGINQRYGEFAVAPARLLDRSDMPNVIAPAWKPQGHRQTI